MHIGRTNKTFYVSLLLVGSLICVFWFYMCMGLPMLESDSQNYFDFGPTRTIGYPVFLYLMKSLNALSFIPVVQLLCIGASAVFAAHQFYLYTQKRLLTLLLLMGLMLNPINHYAFKILTEAFSITLINMMLGMLILFVRQPKWRHLLNISALLGIGILIKPVHYAFIPLLLRLCNDTPIVFESANKRRVFFKKIGVAVPLLVILCLSATTQYVRNGFWSTQSFVGHNLIGKAVVAIRGDHLPYSAVIHEMDLKTRPTREYLSAVPSLQMRYTFTAPYYDEFRYKILPDIMERYRIKTDSMLQIIGTNIIIFQPLQYTADVLMNLAALWGLFDLKTNHEKAEISAYLQQHPLPYDTTYPLVGEEKFYNTSWIIYPVRIELWLCFALSLMLNVFYIVQTLRKKKVSSTLSLLFYISLSIHLHYLLTALLQVGIPRYSMPFLNMNVAFMLLLLYPFLCNNSSTAPR